MAAPSTRGLEDRRSPKPMVRRGARRLALTSPARRADLARDVGDEMELQSDGT
jgi:hypothetical protein